MLKHFINSHFHRVVPGFYFYLPRHLLDRAGHYLHFLPNPFVGGELGLAPEDEAARMVPRARSLPRALRSEPPLPRGTGLLEMLPSSREGFELKWQLTRPGMGISFYFIIFKVCNFIP